LFSSYADAGAARLLDELSSPEHAGLVQIETQSLEETRA
jgi:hypothetical protein